MWATPYPTLISLISPLSWGPQNSILPFLIFSDLNNKFIYFLILMTKLNLKINQKVVVPTDDNTQLNGSKQSDIDDYNDSQAAADQVKIKNQGTLKLTK